MSSFSESTGSITASLRTMSDGSYRSFSLSLLPELAPERLLGVRLPDIKRLAKAINGTEQAERHLVTLPHYYFEEYQLHSYLIQMKSSFDERLRLAELFLPNIDNWSVCDSFSVRVPKSELKDYRKVITKRLSSKHPYTVRFGIKELMTYYLDELYEDSVSRQVADIRCEDYYVSMMCAWYFATALAKQYDRVIFYLESRILDPATHNRAIQGCRKPSNHSRAEAIPENTEAVKKMSRSVSRQSGFAVHIYFSSPGTS